MACESLRIQKIRLHFFHMFACDVSVTDVISKSEDDLRTIICRVLLYDIFEDIIINVFSNRSRLILTLFWSINFLFDDNYQQFCHQVCGRVGSCLIVSFKYNATVVCG